MAFKDNQQSVDTGINYAPWENTFKKVITPFEHFIHQQTSSGILLMLAAGIALFIANSYLAESYQHFLHTPVALMYGTWKMEMSLHHFVNDGLMALFFFVVGLELKREFLVGELSDLKQAALPIIAAVGGMVVPALIYTFFNSGTDAMPGWGIPMATDIAFAVGVLALLAFRVPKALVTFLVALAIADDLGAVLVIALFYTQSLSVNWLMAAAVLVAVLVTLNLSGIRKVLPYFVLAVLLWYALFQSGVHATLAGVIGAFTVPARSRYHSEKFVSKLQNLISEFNANRQGNDSVLTNQKLNAIAEEVESTARSIQTPLQRLEHTWHLPVAFLIIPLFAIINAGIPVELSTLNVTISHPVFMGVFFGLALGKFLGIAGACWIALKLKIGQLPAGASFMQLAAVSVLGGIGFTMSIFIAELAFANGQDFLLMAKTGVFAASLLSGIVGYSALRFLGRHAVNP
ncbi:MAG: Na+/H+ antiporter NhaA [Methylophilus sp.]|uniref:Na+/H+ antiporter NhaA n=1 Tax=Methylophilus sp. TaxID=29541 RepID=UPI003F9F30FE